MNLAVRAAEILGMLGPPGSSLSEDQSCLRLVGAVCRDEATLAEVKALAVEIEGAGIGTVKLVGDIHGPFDMNAVTLPALANEELRFLIEKERTADRIYLFTLKGFSTVLRDMQVMKTARQMLLPRAFAPFSSWTTDFLPWGSSPAAHNAEWAGLTDPRRLVRDLTPATTVPDDIRPWMLREGDCPEQSEVYDLWMTEAARQLTYAFPGEIESRGNGLTAVLKGDRVRTITVSADPQALKSSFAQLHEALFWVYGTAQEAEAKHTILNYHLAMEWPDTALWPNGEHIAGALTNARQAYKLHLHQSSKDLIKNLAELKKSLRDDVANASQSTQALVTGLWRDSALAAAVIVSKLVAEKKAILENEFNILAAAVSFLIILSYVITCYSGWGFQAIAQKSRGFWRERLYAFMEKKDFDESVTDPMRRCRRIYFIATLAVGLVYLTVALYLLNFQFPVYSTIATWLDFIANKFAAMSPGKGP